MPMQEMRESHYQIAAGIVAYFLYYKAMQKYDYKLQVKLENPVAFMTKSNADIMYFDQDMREPDAA